MSIYKRFRRNFFLRGCKALFSHYQSFFIRRSKFCYIADDVCIIPPFFADNPKNVILDNGVSIGSGALFLATLKMIHIKHHSFSGPNLTIITGSHMTKIGRFSAEITNEDKINENPELDKDVIIEEDVWLGANVTILSGVTIGRGCTIAAGAVVTKNTQPYSIWGGVPAKFIKFKWNVSEIIRHENALYIEKERIPKDELEALFAQENEISNILK